MIDYSEIDKELIDIVVREIPTNIVLHTKYHINNNFLYKKLSEDRANHVIILA